jgi:hypothetical protein
VGIAQGQFPVQDILANFRKNKVKATLVAPTSSIRWPRPAWCSALWMQSTMVFGAKDAVEKALDARDGVGPSLLTNNP